MGAAIKVDLKGFKEIDAVLAKFSAENLGSALYDVGFSLEESAKRRIVRHRTPEGKEMAPWSESYRKKVERSGKKKHGILLDRMVLRNSITFDFIDDSLYVGSPLKYASTHQRGLKKKNIPARPYLGFGKAERNAVLDTLEDFLEAL